MTDEPQPLTAQISVDFPCIHCGYNLRALFSGALCPDCGQTIQVVDEGELLRFADPKWIEKLRFGTAMKLWSIVITILMGVGFGIIMVTLGAPYIGHVLIGVASSGMALWGTICITSQEPRESLLEEGVTLRGTVRTLATLGFIGGVGEMLWKTISVSTGLTAALGVIGSVLHLGRPAAGYGELFYFRRFARRIPDQPLTQSTTRFIWASGIMGALWIVFLIAMSILKPNMGGASMQGGVPTTTTSTTTTPAPATAPSNATTTVTVTTPTGAGAVAPAPGRSLAFAIPVCTGSVAALVMFFWYIRLLTKYRKKFQEALDASNEHQAAAQGAAPSPQ